MSEMDVACKQEQLRKEGIRVGFCHVFDIAVPGEQKSPQVSCEHQGVDKPTQGTQGRSKQEAVNHERASWMREKLMDMFQLLKSSLDHFIGKSSRPLKLGNFD